MEAPKVEDLLAGNERFVEAEWNPDDSDLGAKPRLKLAVIGCMDTRFNVEKVLGLQNGDAKIIRNAGNILDDGTLRSVLVAVHLLGVEEICVLGHTKCGMTMVGRGEFTIAKSIATSTGVALSEVMRPDFQRWLGGFDDPAGNVQRAVAALIGHPYLPKSLKVFGLLYDNDTGRVQLV